MTSKSTRKMGSEHFIHDKVEQRKRTAEKDAMIMSFLADEVYSTTDVLSKHMKLDRTVVYRALRRLEKKGFVKLHQIIFELAQTGKQTIWGITNAGAIFVSDDVDPPYFEPSKVSITTISHNLMIQKARINAQKHGFENWVSSRELKRIAHNNRIRWLQIPDAVAEKDGEKYAFEIEKTIKTARRYRAVMSNYVQMFLSSRNDEQKKTVDRVIYLCIPTFDRKLEKIFNSFETVSIGGKDIQLNDNAKARFQFKDVTEWNINTL